MDKQVASKEVRMVWDFFNHVKEGFFVDVGANDPIDLSQTYHLENNGWTGLLIEPQPALANELKLRRKAKVWAVACGAPEETGEAELFLAGPFSGLRKNLIYSSTQYGESVTIPVTTLDEILKQEDCRGIDFLSIDVEGCELNVLRGLDLKRYRPKLILVEDHVRSLRLHRHLLRNGYRLIRRTANVNNWYIPREAAFSVPMLEKLKLFRKMYLGTPVRKLKMKWKSLKGYPEDS